jgi:16S rRNA (cytosine967-C5)-methyltransferase
LLDLQAGQRVLDACAAPGGKSAHILESASVSLTARIVDAARCADVARNLRGSDSTRSCTRATAQLPAAWWEAGPSSA